MNKRLNYKVNKFVPIYVSKQINKNKFVYFVSQSLIRSYIFYLWFILFVEKGPALPINPKWIKFVDLPHEDNLFIFLLKNSYWIFVHWRWRQGFRNYSLLFTLQVNRLLVYTFYRKGFRSFYYPQMKGLFLSTLWGQFIYFLLKNRYWIFVY